ncbi:MAG: hypothetical protein EOP06_00080 [Proteobacteria bacterium]|nr:MAG: hypothetical protein EOP06_00080 [Pseudomonadota bacterium]
MKRDNGTGSTAIRFEIEQLSWLGGSTEPVSKLDAESTRAVSSESGFRKLPHRISIIFTIPIVFLGFSMIALSVLNDDDWVIAAALSLIGLLIPLTVFLIKWRTTHAAEHFLASVRIQNSGRELLFKEDSFWLSTGELSRGRINQAVSSSAGLHTAVCKQRFIYVVFFYGHIRAFQRSGDFFRLYPSDPYANSIEIGIGGSADGELREELTVELKKRVAYEETDLWDSFVKDHLD